MLVLDNPEPFEEIRREFCRGQVDRGIPFHVTLLYPFAPREELSDEVLAAARAVFAGRPPFEFELVRVAAWPDVVYAVPEPDDALRACMSELFARFPQWPPYAGRHEDVIPHATLGEDVDGPAVLGEIERRAAPHLPHRCQARVVSLLEEFVPNTWRERERFALGA